MNRKITLTASDLSPEAQKKSDAEKEKTLKRAMDFISSFESKWGIGGVS